MKGKGRRVGCVFGWLLRDANGISLDPQPTEQSFQLGPELGAGGCINEMMDGLGNGFLYLFPWEPTEIAKGTVWVRVRCSWGSSIKFGTATRLQYGALPPSSSQSRHTAIHQR